MNTKHQVHNLIILDESGSMMSIRKSIVQGFNELVQTVKGVEKEFPEQEHFISMVTFNGTGQKVLHFKDPVSKLKMIDSRKYKPNSSTPLFDAMGFSFTRLMNELENLTDYNVIVTVLTDGEENASKEYDVLSIKKLIDELKLEKWTFTYIGTDHDVESFAKTISITNVMAFEKSEMGIRHMFVKENDARFNLSRKIRNKENTDDNYYETKEIQD